MLFSQSKISENIRISLKKKKKQSWTLKAPTCYAMQKYSTEKLLSNTGPHRGFIF